MIVLKTDEGLYQGTVNKDLKRDGKGLMHFNNGSFYSGEWKEDMIDGLGLIKYYNGDKYMGHFKEGKRDGYGEKSYKSDGKVFKGYWKNGNKEGKGEIYHNNKLIFKGQFENNKKSGYGIEVSSKYIYKGNFVCGKKHGVFEVKYKKNSKAYFVEFVKGKPSQISWEEKNNLINCLLDEKISQNKKEFCYTFEELKTKFVKSVENGDEITSDKNVRKIQEKDKINKKPNQKVLKKFLNSKEINLSDISFSDDDYEKMSDK